MTSIIDVVGNTPTVYLENISKSLPADIYLKLEYLNPWFSVKDRVALNIIETAEKEGKLTNGTHVIEATSGNTGISLAAICAVKGYEITIIMPEFVSMERKLILRLLGANVILTPEHQGLLGPVAKSFELADTFDSCFIADQTRNDANPQAHLKTGEEIWSQMDHKVDVFVSASGTGGHLTGIGSYLKEQDPNIKVIAVEPEEAAVLSGKMEVGEANGNHGIIGIGPGFIPLTLDRSLIDDVIVIKSKDGYKMALHIIKNEGLLVGVSTGAVLSAAVKLASLDKMKGKNIVVIAASSVERYLTTQLVDDARAYIDELVPIEANQRYLDMLV
jgi:cysteine synthase